MPGLITSSPAFLSEASPLRRLPRAPKRPRPADFFERFEDRALFYDCFWHADGARILLVGPAPRNLMPALRATRFTAVPSGTALAPRFHASLSVMVTELTGPPAGTTAIAFRIGEEAFELPVGANLSAALTGSRLLFTMNRDNDLAWVRQWAGWHARQHGTDAVVLFDNGSTRYGPEALVETLRAIDGLRHVAVLSWPHRFGPIDPAVRINPYWARFLQIASMSVVLRRFGAAARGLADFDIDELGAPVPGSSLYELAAGARAGLISFRGRWIEPVPQAEAPDHRAFWMVRRDNRARVARSRKWVLDPSRHWVGNLRVHPYWHWIANRPPLAKVTPRGAFFWHFRGINTNWKDARAMTRPDSTTLEPDAALRAAFAAEQER